MDYAFYGGEGGIVRARTVADRNGVYIELLSSDDGWVPVVAVVHGEHEWGPLRVERYNTVGVLEGDLETELVQSENPAGPFVMPIVGSPGTWGRNDDPGDA